ncbi:hypothetical protein LBMAG52_05130 [Planctomycetia bacterium]|nr:hypothetical protein LBMAG52_05130 [Planctomycetia bacterium]
MSSNWAESSSHVALGGDPLLSAFVATFDAFEFAAWQPVLEEWSECGCGASLFARLLAEWFGVDVCVADLSLTLPIREPARLGASSRLSQSQGVLQGRKLESTFQRGWALGREARLHGCGITLQIGPIPRDAWSVWLTAEWFEEHDGIASAGTKLRLLAHRLLPFGRATFWQVSVEPDTCVFQLGRTRLGKSFCERSRSSEDERPRDSISSRNAT